MDTQHATSPMFTLRPGALTGCAVLIDWDSRAAGVTRPVLERWITQSGGRVVRGIDDATVRVSAMVTRRAVACDERYGSAFTPTLSPSEFIDVLAGRKALRDAIAASCQRDGLHPLLPPEPFNWESALRRAADAFDDAFAVAF